MQEQNAGDGGVEDDVLHELLELVKVDRLVDPRLDLVLAQEVWRGEIDPGKEAAESEIHGLCHQAQEPNVEEIRIVADLKIVQC